MDKFKNGDIYNVEKISDSLIKSLYLGKDLYPSEFVEGVNLTERTYGYAVENLYAWAKKRVLFYKTKDYDLTDFQIERIIGVTVGGYYKYSENEEERETYKRNLHHAVRKRFVSDGILNDENFGRDICTNYQDTQKIVNWLNSSIDFENYIGSKMLKPVSYVIAQDIKKRSTFITTAMSTKMKTQNFAEVLKKVSKPDSLNEFFERYAK